jgi:hypothetical protein
VGDDDERQEVRMEDGEEAEDSKRRSPCCNRILRSVLNPSLSVSLTTRHVVNSKNPRKTTQHWIALPPPSPAAAPPPYLS